MAIPREKIVLEMDVEMALKLREFLRDSNVGAIGVLDDTSLYESVYLPLLEVEKEIQKDYEAKACEYEAVAQDLRTLARIA